MDNDKAMAFGAELGNILLKYSLEINFVPPTSFIQLKESDAEKFNWRYKLEPISIGENSYYKITKHVG